MPPQPGRRRLSCRRLKVPPCMPSRCSILAISGRLPRSEMECAKSVTCDAAQPRHVALGVDTDQGDYSPDQRHGAKCLEGEWIARERVARMFHDDARHKGTVYSAQRLQRQKDADRGGKLFRWHDLGQAGVEQRQHRDAERIADRYPGYRDILLADEGQRDQGHRAEGETDCRHDATHHAGRSATRNQPVAEGCHR